MGAQRNNNVACMLLCEVALGDTNDLLQADFNASNLPPGKHSTKGVGSYQPDPAGFAQIDGSIVPCGQVRRVQVPGASLLYNEFIVYNVAQIRMKYLLNVRFNFKR
eukprot:TRINITY_DN7810_c0_g1_i2.p1 TRINITY_DN7810_c0_g1~~TRINITY_DN7810_c0_g1_i2.p1  ORF type:complete len:115 (-),score=45.28 TRINITY_DN7810_c0_g1_i2:70-387(-)